MSFNALSFDGGAPPGECPQGKGKEKGKGPEGLWARNNTPRRTQGNEGEVAVDDICKGCRN